MAAAGAQLKMSRVTAVVVSAAAALAFSAQGAEGKEWVNSVAHASTIDQSWGI